jgi:predicted nucleic acid-binding protein
VRVVLDTNVVMVGEADYVVIGDADLLDLGRYLGVSIVPPAEAWAMLGLPPK